MGNKGKVENIHWRGNFDEEHKPETQCLCLSPNLGVEGKEEKRGRYGVVFNGIKLFLLASESQNKFVFIILNDAQFFLLK